MFNFLFVCRQNDKHHIKFTQNYEVLLSNLNEGVESNNINIVGEFRP